MSRFIWFDLGYTLLYEPRELAYQRVLAECGHSFTLDTLEQAFHVSDKLVMRQYPDVFGHDPETFMPLFLGLLNHRLGVRLDLCRTWQRLKEERRALDVRWLPFPNVKTVLADLKRRNVRMGVITNWDPTARAILQGHGLECFFEQVVISSEVGLEKPDPAIFELAMKRAAVGPAESLYVGDNYYVDAVGARGVGMRCLIVNRFGTLGVEEIQEPILIHDVSEVIGRLS